MKPTLLVANLMLSVALLATAQTTPESLLGAALHQEEVQGDLKGAIAAYQKIVATPGVSRKTAADALVRMGQCYEKLGDAESRKAYERVVRDYADQKEAVAIARARLAAQSRPPGSERSVVVRQIWTGSDVDAWAQPSPDGRYLAFTDRTRNIAVRDLTTGETRQVTREGDAHNPVFSPDGKQIAYNRVFVDLTGGATRNYSLRIVGTDGSRHRVLVQQRGFPRAWSPDGKQIVIFRDRGDGTGQIVLVSSADGSVTPLKTTGWRYPEIGGFSPDGRYLVYSFTKTPTETGGIYAIATDGSRETPLVEGPAEDFSPVYTPDGKRVVFLSNRSGTVGLWSIGVADGKPQGSPEIVRANMGAIHNLGFTRDGTYFYGTENPQSDSYVADFDTSALRVTSRPKPISDQFVGSNSRAAWSPDGKSIAFLRTTVAEWRSVVIRSAATGEERSLPAENDPNAFDRRLQWFPDNRHLLIAQSANNRVIFLKTDSQTGKSDPIFEARAVYPVAALSPDGKALYYSLRSDDSKNFKTLRLVRRELETGRETILYEAASPSVALFGMSLSPDGGRVAFQFSPAGSKSVLLVIPAEGGEPKQLYRRGADDIAKQSWLQQSWSPDGRYIVFVRGVAGAPRLWTIPVDGGEPRLLEGPFDGDMENLANISFLPDGRGITFTGARTKREIWTIRNLLPDERASR